MAKFRRGPHDINPPGGVTKKRRSFASALDFRLILDFHGAHGHDLAEDKPLDSMPWTVEIKLIIDDFLAEWLGDHPTVQFLV